MLDQYISRNIQKKLTIGAAVVSTLLAVLSVIIIRDTTSFSLFSQAMQGPVEKEIQIVNQSSQPLILIDPEQQPSCLVSMEYSPEEANDENSCFIQFQCQSEALANIIEDERITCHTSDNGYRWCAFTQGIGQCLSLAEWKSIVKRYCGC